MPYIIRRATAPHTRAAGPPGVPRAPWGPSAVVRLSREGGPDPGRAPPGAVARAYLCRLNPGTVPGSSPHGPWGDNRSVQEKSQ